MLLSIDADHAWHSSGASASGGHMVSVSARVKCGIADHRAAIAVPGGNACRAGACQTGHLFIGEVPDDLEEYYAEGYQPIPATEAELAQSAKGDAYRLDLIRRLVPQGDFPEIGPWIGLVAYSAKQAGYRAHVLERDPRCVALYGRNASDLAR